MKVGAIIAEYNPFHNGHKYQIEKFRREQDIDYIIVIMSGDFTQRGEPAWMPKHLRARTAIMGGADLVLELPVYYATGSAAVFAEGAVAHLNALNCVDALSFGCEGFDAEAGHLEWLERISDILMDEPERYKESLSHSLKCGLSYPAARAEALSELIEMPELLAAPNNILALEYITALKKSCSSIQPIPVARKGNGYHDPDSDCFFASASAIRRAIQCENDIDLQEGLPETSRKIIAAGFQRELPMRPEDLSSMFAASFLCSASDLSRYMDVTEEIANRMLSFFKNYRSLPDFLMKIKNRAFTYSRLCRCAAHILLELDKETFVRAQADDYAYYARVLGFRKDAAPLLGYMKKNTAIPILTKMSSYPETLSGNGRRLLEADIRAADYYRTALQVKYGQTLKNEFNQEIIIL